LSKKFSVSFTPAEKKNSLSKPQELSKFANFISANNKQFSGTRNLAKRKAISLLDSNEQQLFLANFISC